MVGTKPRPFSRVQIELLGHELFANSCPRLVFSRTKPEKHNFMVATIQKLDFFKRNYEEHQFAPTYIKYTAYK